MIADPQFADPACGDFRLTRGSPPIDAGLDVGLPLTGGAPNIGALESLIVTPLQSSQTRRTI